MFGFFFFSSHKLRNFLEDKTMTDIVVLRDGPTFWIPTKFLHDTKQITYARLLWSCLGNNWFFAVGKQQWKSIYIKLGLMY